MADLFKFQKTDKLPALKKSKSTSALFTMSDRVVMYVKDYGYCFGNLKQYFKQHENHVLPAAADENGLVFETDNDIYVSADMVLFWAPVPKSPPLAD